jgi:DNA (cytosine-5)-methyltransferase 1
LNVLDLFSGIGGFSLGLERAGMRTVGFCEIEPYCQAVLKQHWPDVPCHDDVRTLRGSDFKNIEIICGGFPCQDISVAGNQLGIEGPRSGLWKEYRRLVSEIRPRFVIVENVAALLSVGMGALLADLASIGYDAEWHCIPASAVGAPHLRDRVWIIAYPAHVSPETSMESLPAGELSIELGRILGEVRFPRLDQPQVLRMDDGFSPVLDGHEALGNAVVPQIPEIIGRAIMSYASAKKR